MKNSAVIKKLLTTAMVIGMLVLGATSVSAANVPLKSIKLNKTSATMNSGSAMTLSVSYNPTNTTSSKTVIWSSSNSAVAKVSKGKVTAVKSGTAVIKAKCNGKEATCKVTVKAAGQKISTAECYTILNNYRKAKKLAALKKDTKLEGYALTRAKELVKKFSHTRPNGQKGLAIIQGNLYKGENIAYGQTSCKQVMTAWYNSTGHRNNMCSGTSCSKKFKKVGIACWRYNGTYYWVQLFSS